MPRLKNIFVKPELFLLTDEEFGGGRRATLRATGLMCNSVCVVRVHSALEGLPGVSKVEFLAEPDRYAVNYDPEKVGFKDFKSAFKGRIVGQAFRGFLGRPAR